MLAGLVFFLLVMAIEPRSLWSGISCFVFLGGTALTLMVLMIVIYDWYFRDYALANMVLVILALLVLAVILFFPVSMIIFFFAEGIRNIRAEGMRWQNMLSLLFSIALALYIFLWPALLDPVSHAPKFIQFLYAEISLFGGYFLLLLTIYCFSAFLNLIHPWKTKKLDEIVVLGSGLMGKKVPPLLAARIDAGLKLLKNNPKAILILSGGQGPGEETSEGAAMLSYCLEHGADPERLLAETKSKNTRENLVFSSYLFRPGSRRIAIVTTRYHVFRALLLAKELGIRCKGYGSKTKWYFTLNAILREFIGYLSMTWKKQLAILAFPALFILIASL